jgi:hypothetical protein
MSRGYRLELYEEGTARADAAVEGRRFPRAWRWRFVAPNGRIVADSGEGYTERRRAARMALDVCGGRLLVGRQTYPEGAYDRLLEHGEVREGGLGPTMRA